MSADRIDKNEAAKGLAFEFEKRSKKVEASFMHGQLPIIWDKAQDFFVFDPLGNKYIDSRVVYLLRMQGTTILK